MVLLTGCACFIHFCETSKEQAEDGKYLGIFM